MTPHYPAIPLFPFTRALLTLAVTLLAGVAVAAVVMLAAGFTGQWSAMVLTAAACFVGAVAGLEPIHRFPRIGAERAVAACLLGMLIRLAVTVGGCVVVALAMNLPPREVAVWAVAWYLLLLVAEVRLLVRYFNSFGAGQPVGAASETR